MFKFILSFLFISGAAFGEEIPVYVQCQIDGPTYSGVISWPSQKTDWHLACAAGRSMMVQSDFPIILKFSNFEYISKEKQILFQRNVDEPYKECEQGVWQDYGFEIFVAKKICRDFGDICDPNYFSVELQNKTGMGVQMRSYLTHGITRLPIPREITFGDGSKICEIVPQNK